MNRPLLVPAVCCLVAFTSLYAALNRAGGTVGDSADRFTILSELPTSSAEPSPSVSKAELKLATLRETYLGRWRRWEESRYQILSRAAPREYSPTSIDLVLSPKLSDERDAFLLASFSIRRQQQTQTVPCVVDTATQRVRIFHEGKWLTEEEWLGTTPSVPK